MSDLTRGGLKEVEDFGWGAPVYSGPAKAFVAENGMAASFFVPFRNDKGEDGILVPVCLPAPEMERFSIEVESTINAAKDA